MTLLKRGAISVGEASEIGRVSRQAVQGWVDAAGWNMKQRRRRFVEREFMRMAGSDAKRVPGKRELRKQAEDAARDMAWREDVTVDAPAQP